MTPLDELLAEAKGYANSMHTNGFEDLGKCFDRLVAVVERQRKFVGDVRFLVECGDIKKGFTTDHVEFDCDRLAKGET